MEYRPRHTAHRDLSVLRDSGAFQAALSRQRA